MCGGATHDRIKTRCVNVRSWLKGADTHCTCSYLEYKYSRVIEENPGREHLLYLKEIHAASRSTNEFMRRLYKLSSVHAPA